MELILGHNQFIGISHISEERSREREKKFSKVENIYKVVKKAAELGYKGMMIETHPRMLDFLNYYKNNRTFDIDFYLQVPYVQGYIKEINEKGLSGLIKEFIHRTGIKSTSAMALKSVVNLAKRDYVSMAISALQLEICPFVDVDIKVLFLHNVITDLLLALKVRDAFIEYIEYVKEKLGVDPGFITLNFQLFKNSFEEWNIEPSFVMTPVNPGGYDMNPSKEAVENAIKNYKGKIMAMNVLGGGAFSVERAHQYLKKFNNIEYCVVGASTEEHLRRIAELFVEGKK